MKGGESKSRYQSYQQGGGSYVPPGATYAEQQTSVLQDTVKTQYSTDAAAANVLNQMHTQRQQLQGARDDVWAMREATANAKRELADLAARNRQRRLKLYGVIAGLSALDFILFIRIVQCHGSFFC
uniref:Uncharacterized protein n=1 Tax=Cyclophora tenuis TaxID=216820 RepID=A0A7S1GJ28_CYCTE|mmetsp:Transcript_14747/g.24979  ORF Transcript_14747/g.24979 Transcript_14747/m.24979 type:complete len:126 (+) Transcript_14747:276-653(+)